MTGVDVVDDARILDAIRALLADDFGSTEGRVIEFYADPRLALTNPIEYARMLQNIFGRGAGFLLRVIIRGLGREFGVQVDEGTTLDECMNALKPTAIWTSP